MTISVRYSHNYDRFSHFKKNSAEMFKNEEMIFIENLGKNGIKVMFMMEKEKTNFIKSLKK